MALEEGKAPPAFQLTDANGKQVALQDFHGRHVIIYFYPQDDTPGCTKEACGFRDAWDEILKYQLDSRLKPCNLVQLMPRLAES